MQVVIIERNAYGTNSERFDIVKNGVIVAGGIHHKAGRSSVWAVTSGATVARFSSKAAMLAALGV